MDWFKDKENRPIVIAIGVGLIAVIIAAIIFMKPAANNNTQMPGGGASIPGGIPGGGASGIPGGMGPGGVPGGAPGGGAPGMPGGMGPGGVPGGAPGIPGGPPAVAPGGMPSAAPVAAASSSDSIVVASNPMEPWRNDPFMPLGYKPRVKQKNIRARISDFPFMQVNKFPQKSESDIYETPQPARRMSGILMDGRLYAIIETEGRSEIVRPGDMLKDGLATVQSVERDRITLKTTGPRSRTIEVRLSSAPKDTTGNAGGLGGMPGGAMGPGMPLGAPGGGMGPGGMPGGGPGMPPMPPPGAVY